MTYFNFLIRGVNGLQEQYKRTNYPVDPTIFYSGNVSHFQGIVKTIQQNDTSKKIQIDVVFEITLISDKVMQNCKNLWSGLQKSTRITFIATLIGGVVGLKAAFTLGTLVPGLLTTALIVGTVALTSCAFSFLALKRSNEASKELSKWTDPTADLVEQCRRLNYRLKAEDAMKAEIETKIGERYGALVELIAKGALYQTFVPAEKASFAFAIQTIWSNHSLKLMCDHGISIPKQAIYDVFNKFISHAPLLKDIKDLLQKTAS